jgi:hypothetical protein
MTAARDYFDHLSQITADIVTATVESINPDNSYMLRTVGRKSLIRATTENPFARFTVNERVRVQILTASRNEHGSNGVILGGATREQRGLSGSTPAEQEDSVTAAAIIHVDPDPLILERGRDAGIQIITGVGLTTSATYLGQGGAENPDIDDAAGPIITPTKVTMTIEATEGSSIGTFDVVVAGARAKDALRIIEPGPAEAEYGFFVLGDGAAATRLITVMDYGDTPGANLPHTTSPELGGTLLRFVQLSSTTYLAFLVGGGGRLVTIDPATGLLTLGALGSHPEPWARRAQIAIVDANTVAYGDIANRYVEVDAATGAENQEIKTAAATPWHCSYYHAPTDCYWIGNHTLVSTTFRLRKINRTTLAENLNAQFNATPLDHSPRMATGDATHIHVYAATEPGSGSGLSRIYKVNATTPETFPILRFTGTDAIPWANGMMFMESTNVRFVHSRRAQGVPGTVVVLAQNAGGTASGSSDTVFTVRSLGMIEVPAAQGPSGVNRLWIAVGTATPNVQLRGYLPLTPGTAPLLFNLDLAAECADYGLGWTPIA